MGQALRLSRGKPLAAQLHVPRLLPPESWQAPSMHGWLGGSITPMRSQMPKLGGPFGMPMSARKHETRLPGEWAWHAGPPGGVAGSRGRRSGRTHATYLARLGWRRSRQARRGRSSACQLRGYNLSVHRAAAKPRWPVSSEHAPARGAGTHWPPTHSRVQVAWSSQPSWGSEGAGGRLRSRCSQPCGSLGT